MVHASVVDLGKDPEAPLPRRIFTKVHYAIRWLSLSILELETGVEIWEILLRRDRISSTKNPQIRQN
jgi:hypothetical protein